MDCTCLELTNIDELVLQVMCDTYKPDGTPLKTNKRADAAKIFENPAVVKEETW